MTSYSQIYSFKVAIKPEWSKMIKDFVLQSNTAFQVCVKTVIEK